MIKNKALRDPADYFAAILRRRLSGIYGIMSPTDQLSRVCVNQMKNQMKLYFSILVFGVVIQGDNFPPVGYSIL